LLPPNVHLFRQCAESRKLLRFSKLATLDTRRNMGRGSGRERRTRAITDGSRTAVTQFFPPDTGP